MHEEILRRSANPAPVVCLGLLLKPFSIGHAVLLDTPAASPSVALAAGVLICSNTWNQNRGMRLDPLLSLKTFCWELRRRWNRWNYTTEAALFRSYVQEGSLEFPPSEVVSPGQESGRAQGSPFLLRLQQFLMLEFRMSESAAWDYPYGLAKCRWAAYWEAQNSLAVKNADEVQFERYIAEQEAKGAAQCPVS